MGRLLAADEIVRQLTALPDWEYDGTALHRDLVAPSFAAAIRIVDDVADTAEQMDHHPDMTIRFTRLGFRVTTHSEGGVTQLDIELAHRIDASAADHGAA
jgi:4a-hydroxytetrahydrobiopterin dehydratase